MGELPLRSLFAFWTGVSGKNQVEQSPPSLVVLEGENCTFQCNYIVSPFNNLRWYTQDTGRGLVSLITMTYSDNRKSNGRYNATVDATAKHSSLHLTAAQLCDPAFYICVVGCTMLPRHSHSVPKPAPGGCQGAFFEMLYAISKWASASLSDMAEFVSTNIEGSSLNTES